MNLSITRRADGWPHCPICGQDELEAKPDTVHAYLCRRCRWAGAIPPLEPVVLGEERPLCRHGVPLAWHCNGCSDEAAAGGQPNPRSPAATVPGAIASVLSLVERRPPVARTPPFDLVEKWLAERRAAGVHVPSVAIHWLEEVPETGRLRPHTWTAGMDNANEIALAVLQQQRALEEWRGE